MNYLDVLLTREMLRVQVKSLKSERLKLENKVNSQNCLFYYLKIVWNFILRSPTFLGAQWTIQPGKTRIFDDRYTVFVWELVSYWPVFFHFSFEARIFFTFQFPIFLIFRMIFSLSWSLCQVVHWNLFDLTPYKGLCVVVYLLNGHLSKDLAPKMGYQY